MNFSAVILAGGESRRMGRDKSWLPAGGQPLLARQIGLARELGAREVFISGRTDTDYKALGCPVLTDRVSGAGPLAGVARALETTTAPLLLVLAVDMPGMEAAFLRKLGANGTANIGVIPRLQGRIEPLAAFYPSAAHFLLEAFLTEGRRAASEFAERCVRAGLARFYETPENEAFYFANWNTPEDTTETMKVSQV